MKSKVEEHCKSKFRRHLELSADIPQQVWEESETPDYYLYVDGTKYAVEVTTLVEKVEVGERSLSSIGIVASLWGLVNEVKETAKEEGILNGAYVVCFSRPIEEFGQARHRLRDELLAYIRETQRLSNAHRKSVVEQGHQRCTIEKLHDQTTYVAKAGPDGGKFEGEIVEEACSLLQERIDTKRDRLRDVSEPKVLLLYDAYRLATPRVYVSCLDDLDHADEFHTVFVVRDRGSGWVLHSRNPSWIS